jgi:hypothetical protein
LPIASPAALPGARPPQGLAHSTARCCESDWFAASAPWLSVRFDPDFFLPTSAACPNLLRSSGQPGAAAGEGGAGNVDGAVPG